MERLESVVLTDPGFTVPEVVGGDSGLAWLRVNVVRFSEGEHHVRRRRLTQDVLDELGAATFSSSPTVSLLRAMGLPDALADDVRVVAASYQPHFPQHAAADAAADRLVAACGGRDEASAARVCVLVQAHAATEALIAHRSAGSDEPPVPSTRRARQDGTLVEVDLSDAHFGAGHHRCPAQSLAGRLADEALS